MAKIMGWDKKGKDKWGNWTGFIYIRKKGKLFTVIRDTRKQHGRIIDLVKVNNQKHLPTRKAARLWAIRWMRKSPHYKTYLSKKKIARLESQVRGKHTSGFRSLKI